ncbi:hypothetical protein [Streptomyces sp. NPDC085596]|uniref:hypothetical protein n=1 Tax=Streptomyces sp. NPDC085596 TaxID=3365731 RepID=UPI0037D7DE3D
MTTKETTVRPPGTLGDEAVLSRLDKVEEEARDGRATHTTFRHITEALRLNGKQCDAPRRLLVNSRPEVPETSERAVVR